MIVHELGDHAPSTWWIGRSHRCGYSACGCLFTLEESDAHIPKRSLLQPDIETIAVRCPGCRYLLELAADPGDEKGLREISR